MRVIVINDDDGHTNALAVNTDNLQALVDCIGQATGDTAPIAGATEAELEAWLADHHLVRQRGGQVSIVEVKESWADTYPCSPLG